MLMKILTNIMIDSSRKPGYILLIKLEKIVIKTWCAGAYCLNFDSSLLLMRGLVSAISMNN